MEKINFELVKEIVDKKSNVISYEIVIDGKGYTVPKEDGNRHYDEIKKQVEAGTLSIQPPDEPETP